jgi:hypothetical protein
MRLIIIFFILISNFANSQEFQNVPVLWTGSEFTKEGEKVSNGHNDVDYYKTTMNYEYKIIFGLNTDIRFSY